MIDEKKLIKLLEELRDHAANTMGQCELGTVEHFSYMAETSAYNTAISIIKDTPKVDSMDDRCEGCDLSKWGIGCKEYAHKHPEDAVRTVKGWIDKHPANTRQSEFLKMYPNARVANEVVAIDPCEVDVGMAMNCKGRLCGNCREEYWLEEVE